MIAPHSIRALPTHYNGAQFRSRLEARWAVWLDQLKVNWTYEPDGFTDGDISYLPDFYLHKGDSYVEIKPTAPSADEIAKGWLAVKATKRNLYFCVGMPPDSRQNGSVQIMGLHWARDDGRPEAAGWTTSATSAWTKCPMCGTTRPATHGMTERLDCCAANPGHSGASWLEDWELDRAARVANSYDFLGDRQ